MAGQLKGPQYFIPYFTEGGLLPASAASTAFARKTVVLEFATAAASATVEIPAFVSNPSATIVVTSAYVQYAANVVGGTTDFTVLQLLSRGTAGTAIAGTVAAKTHGAVGTTLAWVPTALTITAAQATLSPLTSLTLTNPTTGSGLAVPTASVTVEYVVLEPDTQ